MGEQKEQEELEEVGNLKEVGNLEEVEELEEAEELEEVGELEEVEELEEVIVKDIESEKEEQIKTSIIEVVDGIKCEYCGFGNEKTATFCVQCGQIIKKQT